MTRPSALALFVGALAAAAASADDGKNDARAVHERILTLDTHLDTPLSLAKPGWDIMQRHDFRDDRTQVNYPRMVDGGLDGGFFAIFTRQGARTPQAHLAARDLGLKIAVSIREMAARHSDRFALALWVRTGMAAVAWSA